MTIRERSVRALARALSALSYVLFVAVIAGPPRAGAALPIAHPPVPPPPVPWKPVPEPGTRALANRDLTEKCPAPDDPMNKLLQDLVAELMKTVSDASGEKKVDATPSSMLLNSSTPTAQVEVDYGGYVADRLQEAYSLTKGFPSYKNVRLKQFGFHYSGVYSAQAAQARPALNFAADDPSVVDIGQPIAVNNGLQVKIPLRLHNPAPPDGSTTYIRACSPTLPLGVDVEYSADVQEGSNHCAHGEGGPFETSLAPPRNGVCIEPIRVVVGRLKYGAYQIVGYGSHTATPCVGAYSWGPLYGTYNVGPGMTLESIQAEQCEALQNSCSNHGACTGQCRLDVQSDHEFTVSGNWTSQCQGVTMYEQVTSNYRLP